MTDTFPIAVSGASGQLGRMIIGELLERGVEPSNIIAISRSVAKLSDLADHGVVTRAGDFDRPGKKLVRAFAGARRALIISTTPEAPYVKGRRFRQQKAGIDAALAAGTEHIYYTSAPSPQPPTPAIWKEDHFLTEEYLKSLDTEWTILRHGEWPDWHLQENWLPATISGRYISASGSGGIAHITRQDTAAADAGALLALDTAGKIYDLTGPEAMTAAQIIALVSEVSGAQIALEMLEPEELGDRLTNAGQDPLFVPIFVMIAQAIRQGKYNHVTGHAEMLAGRPITTLRQFLEKQMETQSA